MPGAASSMNGSLDRDALIGLLDDLAGRLRRRRVRAHVYVMGGAAMTLAFARERSTHDIDARIDSAHAAVTEAVREIARERQLPGSWLNEQATSFLPRRPDTAAPTLYDSPNLVVTGASPRYLLAMKLRSARGHDEKDVATLIRHLGINTAAEAVDVHDHLFPDTPMTARGHDLLSRIFRPQAEPASAPDRNA